jgi:molecular chaperone GrpE (heat shock protein)
MGDKPDQTVPKLNKWPFLAGDALFLWTACFIYAQSKLPMGATELGLAVGCISAGALLAILPFVLEYKAVVRIAETEALADAVTQIQNLEKVAAQISGATARWQNAQDAADKTALTAKSIAEKMSEEVKAFNEFMHRVNDSEKTTLRLEVEKLRRGESDWVQVLVRLLDHVYALHAAAVRSGQPHLVEQLTNFQNACRDTARRVGLTPFTAEPSEPFDSKRHQLMEGNGTPSADAVVGETVATGYTFQGRLLRPALVRLRNGDALGEKQPDLPLAAGGSPTVTPGVEGSSSPTPQELSTRPQSAA